MNFLLYLVLFLSPVFPPFPPFISKLLQDCGNSSMSLHTHFSSEDTEWQSVYVGPVQRPVRCLTPPHVLQLHRRRLRLLRNTICHVETPVHGWVSTIMDMMSCLPQLNSWERFLNFYFFFFKCGLTRRAVFKSKMFVYIFQTHISLWMWSCRAWWWPCIFSEGCGKMIKWKLIELLVLTTFFPRVKFPTSIRLRGGKLGCLQEVTARVQSKHTGCVRNLILTYCIVGEIYVVSDSARVTRGREWHSTYPDFC